jgi:two-component system alkaline phosphatase synthesis response regulator PhoP
VKRRILIVEDDPSIARMVRDNLVYEGFDVECVTRGDQALNHVRSFAPDLILLDLMLPGLDGLEICRTVAQSALRIPMIIVSARNQSSHKIQGLQIGADDYITKPFMFEELLARIHAVLRRTNDASEEIDLGDIHLDFSALRATKGKKPLSMTHREFEVLRLLWINRDKVVTREQLLRSIWGYTDVPLTRPVDHFIARLRSKIECDPRHPRFLHTVYGDGYRLTPNP